MAPSPMIRTRDNGLQWPRVPMPGEAPVLLLVNQLQRTQNLSPADLQIRQFAQLRALLSHCLATVPYYRERLSPDLFQLDKALTSEIWTQIPVLTRSDVGSFSAQLESSNPSTSHGKIRDIVTSGATSKPLRTKAANVSNIHLHANTVRNSVWHAYDPAMPTGSIVRLSDEQLRQADEDAYQSWMTGFVSGPSRYFDVAIPPEGQIAWLKDTRIGLLQTYPSNLRNLILTCQRGDMGLPDLRAITTTGEPLPDDVRTLAHEVLGLSIQDTYVAQEAGVIALQCPEHDHYHVMAESALVEVLDEAGNPSRPGEIGQVVVTPMHNFAMPLLRYALDDYAIVGPPCPCGRGLPTLKRILGRSRNRMTLPNGSRVWVSIGNRSLRAFAPVIQHQITQLGEDAFRVRIVPERPLTPVEEKSVRDHLLSRLSLPGSAENLTLELEYAADIQQNSAGKFEDFMCEINSPAEL